ncbi:MAG: hypothetical protein JWM80_4761 [Cyanobacteria bacterium RYN_339]|nr:hypothetical protein [Cyanobacteria bacterium RYN_339]
MSFLPVGLWPVPCLAGLGLLANLLGCAAAGPGLPHAALNRAVVRVTPAAMSYTVLGASSVHRWMPDDVITYEVQLQMQLDTDRYDAASARTATLHAKGTQPSDETVFADLPWGAHYRAFVSAYGNRGGVVAIAPALTDLQALNLVPAIADFDFTERRQEPLTVSQEVQVVLDDVPFAGRVGVGFGPPSDGPFVNPTPAVSGSAR